MMLAELALGKIVGDYGKFILNQETEPRKVFAIGYPDLRQLPLQDRCLNDCDRYRLQSLQN